MTFNIACPNASGVPIISFSFSNIKESCVCFSRIEAKMFSISFPESKAAASIASH